MRPPRTTRQTLPRFAVVGIVGIGVTQAVLFVLHGLAGLPLLVASALATETAIITNYIGHEAWTFGTRRFSLRRLVRYNVVTLGGLVITVVTLGILDATTPLHYLLDNLLAIGAGTTWNYVMTARWAWRPETTITAAPLTTTGSPATDDVGEDRSTGAHP